MEMQDGSNTVVMKFWMDGTSDTLTCSECRFLVVVKGGCDGWRFCPGCGGEITRFDREERTTQKVSVIFMEEPRSETISVAITEGPQIASGKTPLSEARKIPIENIERRPLDNITRRTLKNIRRA
jgi:uncharacterized Zn finger protein